MITFFCSCSNFNMARMCKGLFKQECLPWQRTFFIRIITMASWMEHIRRKAACILSQTPHRFYSHRSSCSYHILCEELTMRYRLLNCSLQAYMLYVLYWILKYFNNVLLITINRALTKGIKITINDNYNQLSIDWTFPHYTLNKVRSSTNVDKIGKPI